MIKNKLRYINIGNAITVQINKDYIITAFISWKKEENKYYVTLYINEKTTPTKILISKAEDIVFDANNNAENIDIKLRVTNYINNLNDENFFVEFIEEYEHMIECYNRGFELLEKTEGDENVRQIPIQSQLP